MQEINDFFLFVPWFPNGMYTYYGKWAFLDYDISLSIWTQVESLLIIYLDSGRMNRKDLSNLYKRSMVSSFLSRDYLIVWTTII